ncbi:hypothetical protein [Terriglobus roseus]|uniref:Uncharacterized protein n=1 Tax=Terriglobus roseus TaxID=392734 RepID=A0A1H4J2F1_9BACT|nr:hypothetical protein [Terriglobus roseus]SEB40397.1 hypothetical protein SAMN05443244_0306 [Terriglobus roseus]
MSLWLLRDTSDECLDVVHRWIRRSDIKMREHIQTFGHAGTIVFLNERQYQLLVDAGKRDPRTGYEKRKALMQGAR